MKLRFKEMEVQLILESLDFYARMFIGQYDHIKYELHFNYYKQFSKIEDECFYHLYMIRWIIFPKLKELGFYSSYSIYSDKIDYRAGVAYNLKQELRYKLAYFKHPEGGFTVDFNEPSAAKRDPYPFPYAECFELNHEVYQDVTMCNEQLMIIKDALNIRANFLGRHMKELFSYYSQDTRINEFSEQLDKLLSGIDIDNESIDSIHYLVNTLSLHEVKQ